MKPNIKQVEGYPNLLKDISTSGVINTDEKGLKAAKERKAAMVKREDQIKHLQDQVDYLMKVVEKFGSKE